MPRPIAVHALSDYKIMIRYDDGAEGEVDLSEYVGKGVFSKWKDYAFFERVRIGNHGEIAWDEDIDLCPDSLYMQLTGKRVEDIFPNVKEISVNA